MQKQAVGFTLISLAVVASLVYIALFSRGFFQPLFHCADEVKREVKSPTGAYIATFFERDCGATTDFAAHVNLRPSKAQFDGRQFSSVLVIKGRPEIDLEWKDDSRLSISYSGGSQIYKKLDSWNAVHISYSSR